MKAFIPIALALAAANAAPDATPEADPQYMIKTYGANWANTWNTYRMPMTYAYPSTFTYGYPQTWNSFWKRDAEAEADPQYMINTYGSNWANTWNTYRMPMTYTYPSMYTYPYTTQYFRLKREAEAKPEADPQYMIKTYGTNWANNWNTYGIPMTYAYPSTFTYGYPNSFWKRDAEAQPEADPQYMIKTYGINWANTWNSYRMPMTYTYPRTYTGMSYTYPGNQWFYSY